MTTRERSKSSPRNWKPRLLGIPAYRQIADHIERDIASGALPPGSRIPTQRELSRLLGKTVATMTRAFAILRRRGLVSTEVGRGTFVLDRESSPSRFEEKVEDPRRYDLCWLPPLRIAPSITPSIRDVLREIAARDGLESLLSGSAVAGDLAQRETAAKWLATLGLRAPPSRVVLTAGVQHAMNVAAASLLAPGDVVLCEERTYPGMKALARDFRLTLVPIAMDDSGIDPDAVAKACRRSRPRALYLVPTVHPVTTAMLPHERRVAIAELARKHDLLLIEDDDDSALCLPRPTPIAALAPERTLYLGDLVKPLGVAIRVAIVLAPERFVSRMIAGVRSTIFMTSPLDIEIACSMIRNGSAAAASRARMRAAQVRQRLARSILPRLPGANRPQTRQGAHHLWLSLPSGVRDDVVAAALAECGVEVAPGSLFSVAARGAPALRISLSGEPDPARFEAGLRRLADHLPKLLKEHGAGRESSSRSAIPVDAATHRLL